MDLIASSDIKTILSNKYLLVDSDFLSELYSNIPFLEEFLLISSHSSYLMLDPTIVFEFLRDVYLPEVRKLKEKFVSDDDMFTPVIDHQSLFEKIQNNALLLSKIYAHNQKAKGVSVSDLYLAARLMNMPKNSVLISGNKKHYPSCVFKLETVICFENTIDESIRNFCILSFNQKAFDNSYNNLLKIESK